MASKKIYGTDGNRWIDFLDVVAYAYNITVRCATSKVPFLLFPGQSGFNAIFSGGIAYDTPNGLDSYSPSAIDDSNESESCEQWDFNSEVNDVIVKDDFEITENGGIDAEVLSHFEKLKQKTIDNKSSSLVLCTLISGVRDLKKKDFETNPRPKRKPFESFYENPIYIVSRMLAKDKVELKGSDNDEIRFAHIGIIK